MPPLRGDIDIVERLCHTTTKEVRSLPELLQLSVTNNAISSDEVRAREQRAYSYVNAVK